VFKSCHHLYSFFPIENNARHHYLINDNSYQFQAVLNAGVSLAMLGRDDEARAMIETSMTMSEDGTQVNTDARLMLVALLDRQATALMIEFQRFDPRIRSQHDHNHISISFCLIAIHVCDNYIIIRAFFLQKSSTL
jgi:hypothetical protein